MSGLAGTGTDRAGTRALLRFMLRRERRGLPWWLVGAGFLVGYQAAGSQELYGTPEKLAQQRETLGTNPAMVAMSGPKELLQTVGGEAVFEVFAFVAILIALMSMFLVGRHTRSDEEAGRAEFIRSARVGRHAPLTAALGLASLASLMAGVVVFAAGTVAGLPVGGSALLGAATVGVGITFAAVTAVAVQVFDSPRAVYGAVGAAIGAAYVLRGAGDAGTSVLTWLSPIGWAQQTLPYVDNRWWPLALPVVAAIAGVALAITLQDRRDFGAGLRPTRPGPANASPALGSSLGLAWRLHRGPFIGWTVGIALLAAAYGSFAKSIDQFIADNPQMKDFFPGGADAAVNSYLAVTITFSALLAAAYGVNSALRARTEEVSWRAEPILATRTSRRAWLGSHVTIALGGSLVALAAAGFGEGLAYGAAISDLGQIPRMIGVALAYAPAMWLIIAVAVLGFGWLPRAAAAIAWVAVGYCSVLVFFAGLFDLPAWLRDVSPFSHTPQVPLDSLTAAPLLVILAVTIVVVAGGFAGFRRRDLG